MSRRNVFLLSLLLLLVAGCYKDDPVTYPSVLLPPVCDGTWIGSNAGLNLNISLKQVKAKITGTGVISVGTLWSNVTISGTNAFPNLGFTLYITGYQPIGVSGVYDAKSTINAYLNGSGFTNFPMVLTKQP
ncbi:MAG TPA: hypothetical protein VI758_07765 [Bacteroidota bacterium]